MRRGGYKGVPRTVTFRQELGAYEASVLHGGATLLDPADLDLVGGVCWRVSKYDYAFRLVAEGPRRREVYLHRLIGERLGLTSAPQIDHVNCNKLDNRRSNLRAASVAENTRNRRAPRTNTSGHKGVTWHKGCCKWQAQIEVDGEYRYLGLFSTVDEAAAAYSNAAAALHGEFARVA